MKVEESLPYIAHRHSQKNSLDDDRLSNTVTRSQQIRLSMCRTSWTWLCRLELDMWDNEDKIQLASISSQVEFKLGPVQLGLSSTRLRGWLELRLSLIKLSLYTSPSPIPAHYNILKNICMKKTRWSQAQAQAPLFTIELQPSSSLATRAQHEHSSCG